MILSVSLHLIFIRMNLSKENIKLDGAIKKMIQMSNYFDFKNSNKIQMPVSLHLTYRYYAIRLSLYINNWVLLLIPCLRHSNKQYQYFPSFGRF